MKLSRTTVSIILAAAVLLSAFIVGLVIRQVRLGSKPQTQPPTRRAGELTPDERARIKAARDKQLEESRDLTPEQQEQFRRTVASRVSPPETRDVNTPLDENAAAERARAVQRMRGQIQRSAPKVDANGSRTAPSPNTNVGTSTQDANRPK